MDTKNAPVPATLLKEAYCKIKQIWQDRIQELSEDMKMEWLGRHFVLCEMLLFQLEAGWEEGKISNPPIDELHKRFIDLEDDVMNTEATHQKQLEFLEWALALNDEIVHVIGDGGIQG